MTVTAHRGTHPPAPASPAGSRNAPPVLICVDCERPIPPGMAVCFWWRSREPRCERCARYQSPSELAEHYWHPHACPACGRMIRGERGRGECCSDECARRWPAIRRTERRRKLRAGARDLACADCGGPITGTVCWRGHDACCEPCQAAQREAADREAVATRSQMYCAIVFGSRARPDEDGYNPFGSPHWSANPCPTCGRLVRGRRFCCDPCEAEYENLVRRVEHEPRACESCGKPFTPKRSDARYCGPACKQRVYRQRVTAARGLGTSSRSTTTGSGNA